jgi:hypothetical protein
MGLSLRAPAMAVTEVEVEPRREAGLRMTKD